MLRVAAVSCTVQSMSQAAELVRVVESVRNAGFEIAALKGLSLSVLAYRNLAMRSPGDIDLLVSETAVFEVEHIIKGLGYSRLEPKTELTPRRLRHYLRYHKHFTYFSQRTGTPLELHWRLFDNITFLKETELKFPLTEPVEVGSAVVNTLSRNELFLYLCVHGAVHGWPILKWLADLGAMLSIMEKDDVSNVVVLAKERGAEAELRAALILVNLFLAVEPPPFAGLPTEMIPVSERIVEMGQRLLTAGDYCLEIHRLPKWAMFLYDLRLRSSWRYWSDDLRRALIHPPDWDQINLPDTLFPLYLFVRPVSWLLRHSPRPSRRRSPVVTSPTLFPRNPPASPPDLDR